MKKKYTTPSMVICQLKTQHLLAASGTKTDTTMDFGSTASEGEYGDVKKSRYDVWEDNWSK